MSKLSNKYDLRGVSADKSDVHKALENIDKGLYPTAFCKIIPDIVAGNDDYVNLMHADTAGTKTSLAYIYWKETGDLSVWKGIVQDAIVMNIDDMAAVGITDGIILSSTVGRNKHLISGDVIKTIIQSAIEFIEMLKEYGVGITSSGGETADVGDIVRTIDVGYTTFARSKKEDLIINDIQDGNVIVGLASYGQSVYEDAYNGGMGSNGLTLARHDVFSNIYAEKYPESYDPNTDSSVIYTGSKNLLDTIEIDGQSHTIGKLVLSPTRTYLPVLKKVIDLHKERICGIIHNTGGAHTKVLHFVDKVKIIKDNLLDIPPLFNLIQAESGTDWKEMYKVLNMGTRLEIYTDDITAKEIVDISKSFNIDAQIIGRVERSEDKSVIVKSKQGTYVYH